MTKKKEKTVEKVEKPTTRKSDASVNTAVAKIADVDGEVVEYKIFGSKRTDNTRRLDNGTFVPMYTRIHPREVVEALLGKLRGGNLVYAKAFGWRHIGVAGQAFEILRKDKTIEVFSKGMYTDNTDDDSKPDEFEFIIKDA